ncbi:MAG: helix-turn-helix domain-containing protein [Chloroflexota bacterium]
MTRNTDAKLRRYLVRRFARHLKRRRQERGITQEELALLAGLAPENISHLERKKHGPTLIVCFKISQALNMTVSEFLEGF